MDTEEQLMKSKLESGTGVRAPIIARREFVRAAAATGIAGIFPASLGPLTAHGTAMKAAQLVLPTATKDVAPFKIQVPQQALADHKLRLASTRWPERQTFRDGSQGVPLQTPQPLVASCVVDSH